MKPQARKASVRSSRKLPVRDWPEPFPASRSASFPTPHMATFHELWEIALVLEPLSAQLAAGHASAEDLDALAENLAASEDLLAAGPPHDHDLPRLVALDIAFHEIVARASGNRALMLARKPVGLLYGPAMSQLQILLPQAHSRNCHAHRRIFEGLRRQDAAQAERWMRKHLIDYQRGYVLARLDMDVPISLADVDELLD